MGRPGKLFWIGLGVACASILIDQGTKWWIVNVFMVPPRVVPVTSFFNLVLGWNRGVSFGLFNNGSDFNVWILSGLALAVVTFLLVWLYREQARLVTVSLGLVIGGAMGNVIDRLRFGGVTDFLDFHLSGYHWPAFNLADTSIVIGAVILIADSLFAGKEKPNNRSMGRKENE